jgi:GNAT superfamily N-acetyltransferase
MIDPWTIQSALHARMELECAAARATGLPGVFETWQHDGLFASCVTDPALPFLAALVVTGSPDVDDLRTALADRRWRGIVPGIVFWDEPASPVDGLLRDEGYTVHGSRPVAVRTLNWVDGSLDVYGGSPDGLVVGPVAGDALDEWVAVLLSAYEADGAIAQFIAAGHRDPRVRRFAAWREGAMVAVAALSVHGAVAVLGGAATLPAWRGKGAQGALLRHRLRVAREAGCLQATATAAPASPSARNLERAGFLVRDRPSRQAG